MTTEPTVQARAAVALGSSKAESELIELAGKSKDIVSITNNDGRTECHTAAMAAKNARVNIEKAGKSAREDATAFSKAVIAEEKRLVDLIAPEEKRLIELRDVWDAKVKAEKEAAEAIEAKRIADIKARIAAIADAPLITANLSAESTSEILDTWANAEIDDSYAEFYGDACAAKAGAVAKLREIFAAKTQSEALAAKIKAEQEAEATRLAAERERIAAERAELDRQRADLAAQQAAAKAEQDRIAAEEIRAIDAARKADQAKAAAEVLAALPPVEPEPVAEVVQPISATPARDTDRTGPRVTSLRIQISEELDKLNVFQLANVLAYCQALPFKSKLAA